MSALDAVKLLALIAEQSGENVSPMRLEFIARALDQEADQEAVIRGLQKLAMSARRFPTLAEIKDAMGQGEARSRDSALLIADLICSAIVKYGLPSGARGGKAIELALGPAAWHVVQRLGGWTQVVEQSDAGLGIIRAQLRDTAESCVRTGGIEGVDQIPTALPTYAAALELAGPPAGTLTEGKRALLEAKRDELRDLVAKSAGMSEADVMATMKAIDVKYDHLDPNNQRRRDP